MLPVTRQEKIEGEAAWKKCMANGSGKMKKRVLQRGASRSRSGERSEPKLRQGCSVAAMKKNSLGIAATATATATAMTTTMARRDDSEERRELAADKRWLQRSGMSALWSHLCAFVRVCVRTMSGCVLARSWAGILVCEHKTCCWQLSHAVA